MKHGMTEIIFSPGGSTENIADLCCTFANWSVAEKVDLLQAKNMKKGCIQQMSLCS